MIGSLQVMEASKGSKGSQFKYLHAAVRNEHEYSTQVVRCLVEGGATVDHKDGDGRTAMHYATQNNRAYGTTYK